MISLLLQGKPFNITVIQVYAPKNNPEEAEWFYEGLQDLLELIPKKQYPFHHRGLESKSRKSRDTWSNRKVWPWSKSWSRAKVNRVLPSKRTGHSNPPLLTIEETILHMDITRLLIPKLDWSYSWWLTMEKLYTVIKTKTRSWLWLRPWTPYCKYQT